MVTALIEEPEAGKIYNGVVKRITDFGAFIEFLPGKEGLCHISKLSKERVNSVTDVLSEGQEIPVKLIEIDRMGRVNLSYIEAIDPDYKSSENSHDRAAETTETGIMTAAEEITGTDTAAVTGAEEITGTDTIIVTGITTGTADRIIHLHLLKKKPETESDEGKSKEKKSGGFFRRNT